MRLLRLINRTKGKTIAENVIAREKLCELITGLIPYKIEKKYPYDILKKKIFKKEDGMLFKVRFGKNVLHTFFMSFPISAFFLDKKFKVVEKVRLDPFRIYFPKKRFKYFLELYISKFHEIELGDELVYC